MEWKGCDPDDEWYPARNIKNSPILLKRFHEQYPDMPGPPVRLQNWIQAAAEDAYDDDQPDDTRPQRRDQGREQDDTLRLPLRECKF